MISSVIKDRNEVIELCLVIIVIMTINSTIMIESAGLYDYTCIFYCNF